MFLMYWFPQIKGEIMLVEKNILKSESVHVKRNCINLVEGDKGEWSVFWQPSLSLTVSASSCGLLRGRDEGPVRTLEVMGIIVNCQLYFLCQTFPSCPLQTQTPSTFLSEFDYDSRFIYLKSHFICQFAIGYFIYVCRNTHKS